MHGTTGYRSSGQAGCGIPVWRGLVQSRQAGGQVPVGERAVYTVLIVDDSPFIRDILRVMLTRGGYTIITASGAAECRRVLEACLPDIILLDIMMEPVNGWETLRALRQDTVTAGIPVIMITAKPLTPQEVEEHGSVIEDYLVKPITHGELYGAIEGLFDRRARVDREVAGAVKRGAGEKVLTEYRDLCRLVFVRQRLLQCLGETLRSGYIASSERPGVTRAIEEMRMEMQGQELRIREIREGFPKVEQPEDIRLGYQAYSS